MSRFSRRQWMLAVLLAMLIHGGVAYLVLRSPPDPGAVAGGLGGSFALGPAGRAPGAVETPPPTATEVAEPVEEPEEVTPDDQPAEEPQAEDVEEVDAPDEKVTAAEEVEDASADKIEEITPESQEEVEADESDNVEPEATRPVEDSPVEAVDQAPASPTKTKPVRAVDGVLPDAAPSVAETTAENLKIETEVINQPPDQAEVAEPEEVSTVAVAEAAIPQLTDAPLGPQQEAEEISSLPPEVVASEEEPPKEAEAVQSRDIDQPVEPSDIVANSPEAIETVEEPVEVVQPAEIDEASELKSPPTVSDAAPAEPPEDVVLPPVEVVPESLDEASSEPAQTTIAEAREVVPDETAARSPNPAPTTTDFRPSPRKPPPPQEENLEPPPEEAVSEPAQLAGVGGEAGDRDEGDVGSGESATGGGAVGAQADYFAVLQAWLEQHKVYPRRALSRRLEGVVALRFVMDRQGKVIDYNIEESSGHRLLDHAVETLIERAQPLPTMPDDIKAANLTLVVPISFVLN